MRKRILAAVLVLTVSAGCIVGCGNAQKNDTSKQTNSESTSESSEKKETSAVSLLRTGNSDTVDLNKKDVIDPETLISWVKIATIWDPELTLYDASSFVQGSKAIAVTFEVSDMDVESMTCYWNYMVADAEGTEISCWDTNYQTDDVEISGDGKYQMVFDYSKVEGGDVSEIKSLQIVFPGMKTDTKMKVKVTEAVCITDEEEIGAVYQTGAVE